MGAWFGSDWYSLNIYTTGNHDKESGDYDENCQMLLDVSSRVYVFVCWPLLSLGRFIFIGKKSIPSQKVKPHIVEVEPPAISDQLSPLSISTISNFT